MNALYGLKCLCRHWGGRLIEVSAWQFRDVSEKAHFDVAPFTCNQIGIKWKAKQVVYSNPVNVPDVIHEMGHVFASISPPDLTAEWPFFGWEYLLAKKFNIVKEWRLNNDQYTLPNGQSFGSYSRGSQDRRIAESIEQGKRFGIIGPRGQVRAAR